MSLPANSVTRASTMLNASSGSVLNASFNCSLFSESFFANKSTFAPKSLTKLFMAVAPRSGKMLNSWNAADNASIFSGNTPNGASDPPIRLAKSMITGAVAFPDADKTFNELPIFKRFAVI